MTFGVVVAFESESERVYSGFWQARRKKPMHEWAAHDWHCLIQGRRNSNSASFYKSMSVIGRNALNRGIIQKPPNIVIVGFPMERKSHDVRVCDMFTTCLLAACNTLVGWPSWTNVEQSERTLSTHNGSFEVNMQSLLWICFWDGVCKEQSQNVLYMHKINKYWKLHGERRLYIRTRGLVAFHDVCTLNGWMMRAKQP